MSDLEPPQQPNLRGPGQPTETEQVSVPRGWLWAMRGAALAVIFPGAVAIGSMFVSGNPNAGPFAISWIIVMLPHFSILGGLGRTPSRMTLIFAGLWGSLIALLLSLIAVPNLLAQSPASSEWWMFLGLLVLGGGAHAVMVVGAFNVTRALPPEPGRFGRILRALFLTGVSAFLVVMVTASLPSFIYSRMSANDASAAGSMRLFVSCAEAYSANNPKYGYPAGAMLMKTEDPDCIDPLLLEALTGGDPKNGYLFEYVAGAPDGAGTITTFEVIARPAEFGRTGSRGYFSDETSVTRFTREDRPATKDDAPL